MATTTRVPARARNAVRRRAGELATAATQQIEQAHGWYGRLSAQERSWVAQVAQAGIADFVAWLDDGGAAGGGHRPGAIFAAAPRALTRSITLAQTLELVREVVEVVEDRVESVARPDDVVALREAVLRYSREVAFGAALVYAQAAEQRGAWDARLEALLLDAVLRGEIDESIRSRASALGWTSTSGVVVVVGAAPDGADDIEGVVSALHRAAGRRGLGVIGGVQGRRLVAVLGDVTDVTTDVAALSEVFGDGPLVHGPVADDLVEGALSAAAALAGHEAAAGWPGCPRPSAAADLLPERALAGDEWARLDLVEQVWQPLREQPALLGTARAYLDARGGLEETARVLFVHVNTVRYRLGRIADVIGYDLADPHDAFTVRTALTLGWLLEESSKTGG